MKDGQYGHGNHWIVELNSEVAGITSAWHADLAPSFHQATLQSIVNYYGAIDALEVVQRCKILNELIPPPADDGWCIGHFAVSKAFQGQGIGKMLLEHMRTLAIQNGKVRLTLDVELNNKNAIQFYQHWGFNSSSINTTANSNDNNYTHMYRLLF